MLLMRPEPKYKPCPYCIRVSGTGTLITERQDGLIVEADGTLHSCRKPKPVVEHNHDLWTPKENTMAKLIANIARKEDNTTSTEDMAIGQIAEVRFAFDKKDLLLRTLDGFVDLRNPFNTYESTLNRIADILPDGSTVTLTVASKYNDEMDAKVLEFLNTGDLIRAIKEVRSVTNMGLKEAKEYVENFRSKAWQNGTLPKTAKTRYPGAVEQKPYVSDEEPDNWPTRF